MRKKNNYPIRYNWTAGNYPIKKKDNPAISIKSGDSGMMIQTTFHTTDTNMRQRYLTAEQVSSSSDSSSDSESEQDQGNKALEESLLKALQEQGSGTKNPTPVETREEAPTNKVSPVPTISGVIDLESTNKELEILMSHYLACL
jgi:hypothetical protein